MKTLGIVVLAVAGGAVGACVLLKYCKKKPGSKVCTGCGCGGGCSGSSTATPAASDTPSAAMPAAIQADPAPGSAAAIAADGKGGWIRQPQEWSY